MRHTYSFWKLFFLSPLTFGIYPLVKFTQMGDDIEALDHKSALPYWAVALFISPITLGIFGLVWWHKICNRIGNLGPSNGLSAGTYWGWNILGSFLLIGPFVFMWKLCNALTSLKGKTPEF